MEENLLKKETFEEIKRFLTFKNPNNFDEYVGRVLPRTGKNYSYSNLFSYIDLNYTWITKNSILNKKESEEEKIIKKSNRKQKAPKRIEWVDCHVKEISHYDPYIDLQDVSSYIKKKQIENFKKKQNIEATYYQSIEEKNVSKKKNLRSNLPMLLKDNPPKILSKNYPLMQEYIPKSIESNKFSLRKSSNPPSYEQTDSNLNFPFRDDISSPDYNNYDNEKEISSFKDENIKFYDSYNEPSNANLSYFSYIHKNNLIDSKQNEIIRNSHSKSDSINKQFAKKETNTMAFKNFENESQIPIDLEKIDDPDQYYPFSDNESSTLECMLCKWIYPKEMNSEEKNVHVNFCLEGRGQDHRVNYMKSLRVVNLTLNSDNQEPIESCPYCGKVFKQKGQKIRDLHMIDCLREKEENEIYKDKKRKTTRINYSSN